MYSRRQSGFEEWLRRRADLVTALGLWAAGFVVAGASLWRMQHPNSDTYEMRAMSTSIAEASPDMCLDNASTDTAESEGAVFVPEDVIVARKTPVIGATQMQTRR